MAQVQRMAGLRPCSPGHSRSPRSSRSARWNTEGARCKRPVNLVGIFRTLNELCGLPEKKGIGGNSLVPLLRDPAAAWPHAAVTHFGRPQNFSVSTERWRYLHYFDGGEELYDISVDPYEWRNLAGESEFSEQLARLRGYAPKPSEKAMNAFRAWQQGQRKRK